MRSFYFVLLFACSFVLHLSGQDTAKVLLLEGHSKVITFRIGQEIKVSVANENRPVKGVLREISDSTIRIDSSLVRLSDIKSITWYELKKGNKASVLLITAGGILTVSGVLLIRQFSLEGSSGPETAVNTVVGVVIGAPVMVAGLVMMAVGVVTADTVKAHKRTIGEEWTLRADGNKAGKPGDVPGKGTAD